MRIYFSLLSLLVAATYALSPIEGRASDLDNYNIYGRLSISYQLEENEVDGEAWKLENNASRFGVLGSLETDNDLVAVYQIELGVETDDGDKNGHTLSQRDTFVGVRGEWGQLIGGRITIPFKEAKGSFDYFNDLQGELGKIIDGEERMSNVLQYDSQQLFGPLTATLAIIPGEDSLDEDRNGPADGVSGSLNYQQDNFYLSLAFNNRIKQLDQTRLVGTWRFNDYNFGLFYQNTKTADSQLFLADQNRQGDAYGISSSFYFSERIFKAQYIISDASKQFSNATQASFAVDQFLAKSTTLFSYLTIRDCDDIEDQNSYFAIGIKHNF